ncbi:DUF3105 domain-containing protein [Nostoc sp. UHCC 0251]
MYKDTPADGFLVHNLEHGGVTISYNPKQIKDQDKFKNQSRFL